MAPVPEFFPGIEGFEWDEGNSSKNWRRHQITQTEAEQVFQNRPMIVAGDLAHSESEARYFAVGRTDTGRLLTVVFTLRRSLLRVISARPMSRREDEDTTMPRARRAIPTFTREQVEREFWETHDASPFVDWDRARTAVFPNLRPSTETISLRLPTALLSELKALAGKRDVPYQSLLKVFLADRVASEMVRTEARPGQVRPPMSRRPRTAKGRKSPHVARD